MLTDLVLVLAYLTLMLLVMTALRLLGDWIESKLDHPHGLFAHTMNQRVKALERNLRRLDELK